MICVCSHFLLSFWRSLSAVVWWWCGVVWCVECRGGSAEGRRRFLLEILRGVRSAIADPNFLVCIKLNSTDFQPGRALGRGGATTTTASAADSKQPAPAPAPALSTSDECVGVIEALQAERLLDFLELSGGTYEQMTAMQSAAVSDSTQAREAFFLAFAELIRARVSVPLLVTGGFRSAKAMNQALHSGVLQLVGLGRPFCVEVRC